MGLRSAVRTVFCCLVATLLAVAGHASAAPAPGRVAETCSPVDIPVRLDIAVPVTMHGELCRPAGQDMPRAVQVLLHGATYNSTYWDMPVKPERYSYVRAATRAGYATLNLDRIGYGRSTHVPSATLTALAQADAVHQVIGKLRDGKIGNRAFEKVILAGHSVGSGIAAIEASLYRDVDGLILTGMTHHFSPTQVVTALVRDLYPVTLDPRFAAKADPGYLTTKPGGRERLFYAPGDADPAVVAEDERTKDITSTTEVADAYTVGFTAPITQMINAPVLMVVGSEDAIFCQGALSSDCASAEAVKAGEALHFGPAAELTTHVVHGSGHDIALSKHHSREAQRTLLDWSDRVVGSR